MPVQKLNRAIMYRAYPTPEQQVLLSKTFGCVRFVWNHMLMDAQRFLEEAGAFFIPTPAKYKTEFSFLKEVDSLALANAQLDLKNANKRHREDPKAVGSPRLKSKRKSKMSYTTNNQKMRRKDGAIKNTIYVVGKHVHIMQGIAGSKDGKATTYKDSNANSITASKCKFVAKNSGILFV